MLTINPINFNSTRHISFKENYTNANMSKVGLMSLDRNPSNKINFEKDLNNTQKADMVQTNPFKAIGYNLVKAYNILCTPKRSTTQTTESNYFHLPYMA